MSIDQEVEVLRQIPLFANIEPAKLKLMAFASERLTFKGGQSLFHQGDAGDAAYIIVDGAADVIVDTPDGPLKVATLNRNDIVGEIAILCDQGPVLPDDHRFPRDGRGDHARTGPSPGADHDATERGARTGAAVRGGDEPA